MSELLRDRLHIMIDQLPDERLSDVLQFVEMLVETDQDLEMELEDAWLLASGAFRMVYRDNEKLPTVIRS